MAQNKLINFWLAQCQNLYALAAEDAEVSNGGPYTNKQQVKEKIENLLIRYAIIANILRDIADTIKTPILTHIIRKTFELTVSRRLQLQHELIRLMSENFFNVDNLLIFNSITPYDIQLKLPYYLKKEGLKRKQNIDEWFEDYLTTIEDMEEDESEISEITKEEVKEGVIKSGVEAEVEVEEHPEEKLEPLESIEKKPQLEKDFIAREKNYDVQKMLKERYSEMISKTIDKFRNKYGRIIEEGVEDEIIEWIEFFFSKTGQLPVFPSKELVFATGQVFGAPGKDISKELKLKLSPPADIPTTAYSKEFSELPKIKGSQLIVTNHWIHPDDWLSSKNSKQKKPPAKKNDEDSKEKKKKKKKSSLFKLEKTDYFSILNILKVKLLETCEIEGDVELNAMVEVGLEIRSAVDELMREELKSKKKKKKKSKKRKGRRKGKKVLPMVTDDVKAELANYRVFRQGHNTSFYDKFGEFTPEMRAKYDGELLDFLHHRCVLPLSSTAVHHFSPLTRSMCLLGQQNSGKEHLLDALVTETGSALFDLSPAITANIYPGKKGMKTLVSLVGRLARQMQPSIIFIADVDKILSKKVSKKDKATLNPRRLTRLLPKLIKSIDKNDRVLIVATATEPWLAKRKKINKAFDSFLYIPSSNYDTHLLAWKDLVDYDLITVTALAKTTSKEKYIPHNLEEATVNAAVAENMIDNLPKTPDLQGKFNKFLEKTPMGKRKKKDLESQLKTKKSRKR